MKTAHANHPTDTTATDPRQPGLFDQPARADVTVRPKPREVDLTVIVPLAGEHRGLAGTIARLGHEAAQLDRSFEVLVIADAPRRSAAAALGDSLGPMPGVEILALRDESGESAVLREGFRRARGSFVITMPAEDLFAHGALGRVLSRLEAGDAFILARRAHTDSSPLLHWILRGFTRLPIYDLGCGLRGMTRKVAKEVADSAELHRFLPFLAHRYGHHVRDLVVEPGPAKPSHLGSPLRGTLDLFAVLFLLHFARAPLRMFGLIGAAVALAGVIVVAWVTVQRFGQGIPLATRPVLVLGVLWIVLGVQTAALGLLGEITVFARSRRHREYRVERILK